MKDLIEKLKEIDNDFYRGGYTFGQKYELILEIGKLINKLEENGK